MKKLLALTLIAVFLFFPHQVRATGQNGTTLTADVSMNFNWTKTFGWTIAKQASPSNWDLFIGDQATSQYTVSLTKDNGTTVSNVTGQVCVTNGGAVATENLSISNVLTMPPSTTSIASTTVDVSGHPILASGESHCYDYSMTVSSSNIVGGASYKVTSDINITNHSGHLGTAFGPNPSISTTLNSGPTLINDTVNVSDTNGSSWVFNQSGSQTYTEDFTCGETHKYDNTVTITETGANASATVQVNCYDPTVTKTAVTSFDRNYTWNLLKTGDQTNLTLEKGQSFTVNYLVNPTATYTDSDWQVEGTITVDNPAPIPAVINSVSDLLDGVGSVTANCPVTFPYTLAAGSSFNCSYLSALPDSTTRINTASAQQQNFVYSADGSSVPGGTTSYTGTASVDFTAAQPTKHDDCVTIADDKLGASLGQVCYQDLPKTISYSLNVGPYDTCGSKTFVNTASFVSNSTSTTGSSSWTVNINVPCPTGCTLTQGYWKNHSGAWKTNSLVLGTVTYTKSQLLSILTTPVSGNGLISLAHQLIAAKLNIVSGASSSGIAATITASDVMIGSKIVPPVGNGTLKTSSVSSLVGALDNFNSGLSGVPHCSE